jgi:hypothetical protein
MPLAAKQPSFVFSPTLLNVQIASRDRQSGTEIFYQTEADSVASFVQNKIAFHRKLIASGWLSRDGFATLDMPKALTH